MSLIVGIDMERNYVTDALCIDCIGMLCVPLCRLCKNVCTKNGTYCKLYCVRFARFNKRKSVSQSVDTVMDIGHVGNSRHRIRLYVL